jgi:hypothetical protein
MELLKALIATELYYYHIAMLAILGVLSFCVLACVVRFKLDKRTDQAQVQQVMQSLHQRLKERNHVRPYSESQ